MRTPSSIASSVREWLADHWLGRAFDQPVLTPEQGGVAEWLRGDERKCESLKKLFYSRIEGRGMLPVPSTPHDAAVQLGRDAEARELSRLLLLLCKSPMPVIAGSEDLHEPGEHNRAPYSRTD